MLVIIYNSHHSHLHSLELTWKWTKALRKTLVLYKYYKYTVNTHLNPSYPLPCSFQGVRLFMSLYLYRCVHPSSTPTPAGRGQSRPSGYRPIAPKERWATGWRFEERVGKRMGWAGSRRAGQTVACQETCQVNEWRLEIGKDGFMEFQRFRHNYLNCHSAHGNLER